MKLQTNYFQVPTEEQREYARKSVNSTAESVKRDVQHLIEWIEKQPHMPNYRDEDVLAHILLQCNNSLEKVKRRFQKLCIVRGTFLEIFCDRNPYEKCYEDWKNVAMFVPLRKLTPDGYRIVIFNVSDDIKDIPPAHISTKLFHMAVDVGSKLDYTRGLILVFDGTNYTMSLIAAYLPEMQKFVFSVERGVPASFIKIYICNMWRAAEVGLAIAKTIISKKLAQRIEVLKNPTDLGKIFPKDIIPREYGGDELPLKQLGDLWFEDIKMNHDYLKYLEQFTPDLAKLPKDYLSTELSDLAGSFRQISVD